MFVSVPLGPRPPSFQYSIHLTGAPSFWLGPLCLAWMPMQPFCNLLSMLSREVQDKYNYVESKLCINAPKYSFMAMVSATYVHEIGLSPQYLINLLNHIMFYLILDYLV